MKWGKFEMDDDLLVIAVLLICGCIVSVSITCSSHSHAPASQDVSSSEQK